MVCFSVGLVLIEHNVPVRVAARSVQPHIAVRVRTFSRLMQHLQRGFICMKNLPLYQFPVQAFVYGLQPVLCRAQNPARHGLPGQMNAHAFKLLFLPVQRRSHDKLLRHDLRNGFRRGKAARNDCRFLRCLYNRRMLGFVFAGLTGIRVVPILTDAHLRRDDLKRSADFLADFLHHGSAFLTDTLFFGNPVLYDVHRYILRQNILYAAAAALSFMRGK